MHVLFLTENFPPEVNAVATRVYERAVHWVKAGHEVTVVTSFPNFPQGRIHDGWRQRLWDERTMDGIRVIRLPTYMARNEGFVKRTLDFVSFMAAAVAATPRLPRADVVAATSPQFFAAVAGWAVSRLKRRPFVFEISDLWPASIRAVGAIKHGWVLDLLEKLELFLYRQAAAIVALTDSFQRDLVRRGVAAEKIAVIRNGVDLERYSPRPKDVGLVTAHNLTGRFVIGYIGTLGMAHGLENVLGAARQLSDHPEIAFLLVGDGASRERLEQEARRMNLRNIVFTGQQPKSRIAAYWSVCDAALVHLADDPVFAEVIPSKIFEAMAMGLPILLVSPEGEASRIVQLERAGVWVPAGNPAAVARAAQELSAEPETVRAFAERSRAAAARYTREHQARTMWSVFERVGAQRTASEAAR